MPAKTAQLQIRVTLRQKAALRRRAASAGLDLSAFVLARSLGDERGRFAALLATLAQDESSDTSEELRFGLAELHDFLADQVPMEFTDAVAEADLSRLSVFCRNYVAAMVEVAADRLGLAPPAWVREVAPLDEPWFATPMRAVRLHLLRASPVPFNRRNLFVDAAVGDRV